VPCAPVWTRFFEGGRREVPLYVASCLAHGHEVQGPALVVDNTSTIVVEPNCTGLCHHMQHRVQPCVGLGHAGPRPAMHLHTTTSMSNAALVPYCQGRYAVFALQVC
jgi:hypothetical protein